MTNLHLSQTVNQRKVRDLPEIPHFEPMVQVFVEAKEEPGALHANKLVTNYRLCHVPC